MKKPYFITIFFSLLLAQGCVVRQQNPYSGGSPDVEIDEEIYDATQKWLAQLTARQAKALEGLKKTMEVGDSPCAGQYVRMYSEGYATGYAYFKLTKNWLEYHGGVKTATPHNAYLAGWYEGQAHARPCNPIKPYILWDKKEKYVPDWNHGFYQEAHYFLNALPDGKKERMKMEREKMGAIMGGRPPVSDLYSEIYRKGFLDGCAYGVVTEHLHTSYWIREGGLTTHLPDFKECSPSREAYVEGWNSGQCMAYEGIVLPKRIQTSDDFNLNGSEVDIQVMIPEGL